MGCEYVQDAHGQVMLIRCSRGRQPPVICAVCHARPMTRRCDAVVTVQRRTPLVGGQVQERSLQQTCSRPLCAQCRIRLGPDEDRCPDHAPPEHAALAQRIKEAAHGPR